MRYHFAQYVFDGQLGVRGPRGHVALGRRETALLRVLLEAGGAVVSKDAIARQVWHDPAVSDDAIFQAVRRLRAALPSPAGMRIVETVYGAGVRIGVPLHVSAGATAPAGAVRATQRIDAEACLVSARELAAGRSRWHFAEAIAATTHALEIDPEYIPAWCALAEFHILRAARSLAPARSAGAAITMAAGCALALDPDCAPALAARGFVRATIERDIAGGLADVDRSLLADPRYWTARGLRGWVLAAAGRIDEAVDELRAALDVNPWSPWYPGMYAQYLMFAGKHSAALDAAREAMRRFPGMDMAHFALSMIASAYGHHDEAIAAGQQARSLAPDTPLFHTALAAALARAGRHAEARRLALDVESSEPPIPALWLAPAWHALGDRRRALAMVRLARVQRAPQQWYWRYDPRFAELCATARDAGSDVASSRVV
jgi:DNA-binding winged helix-turn-helix (wHTH) protein/tetratricopeptide (TPR) repeat protein